MTKEQRDSLVDVIRDAIEDQLDNIIYEVIAEVENHVEHLDLIDECYNADSKRVKVKEKRK